MGKTVYQSKRAGGLMFFLGLVTGSVVLLIVAQGNWWALLPLFLIVLFLRYLLFSIYYIIDGRRLIIKCGFWYTRTIEIDRIKKVTPSNSIMSAPAASLDRLEIVYNAYDSVLVSPKDKEGFVKQLKILNPKLEARLQ